MRAAVSIHKRADVAGRFGFRRTLRGNRDALLAMREGLCRSAMSYAASTERCAGFAE